MFLVLLIGLAVAALGNERTTAGHGAYTSQRLRDIRYTFDLHTIST